jgi:hypothetical protein
MGYGQGDYGQGDYGQGDPGLFSFLGKALGTVVHGVTGAIGGFLKGGPLGAITGGITGLAGSGQGNSGAGGGSLGVAHAMVNPGIPATTSHTSVGYGLFAHDVSTGAVPATGGGARGRYGAPGQAGYHQVKRGPHAGSWVRNRHMNITNPRALRRAIRRGKGFEKMARRMLGFATPHKPKGRMYFKAKAKR